jgi:DNA end-binding protein Ku
MATTVWKGHLGFGLVSIPVRLYRAARKERIPLRYVALSQKSEPPVERSPSTALHTSSNRSERPDLAIPDNRSEHYDEFDAPASVSRISQTMERSADGESIRRSDLVRGHEVAPNQFVTFGQEELRRLRLETSTEMTIVRSVRLEEIDPVYFETSYYVKPDTSGERAYSLLFQAFKESRYVGLATVVMHGREHVVIVRPGRQGLLAHTMFYDDEVHAENEFKAKAEDVASKELQLARTFVEAIAGPFAPEEFKDTYREKLGGMISSKLGRGEMAAADMAAKPVVPVMDIMEALKDSIAAKMEPTARELAVKRREPGRVTALKGKASKRRA